MPTLEQLLSGAIKIGNTTYQLDEIKYGGTGQTIWPTAYTATLTVVWVMGGQYALSAVPAAGGTATATWTLHIFREGTEVHTATVYPDATLKELVNGEWVATNNFSYDKNNKRWVANDRGTNGQGSSGTNPPVNAPQRTCSLTATFTMEYQGVNVSAQATATMTQNANAARQQSVSYSNLRVSLGQYGTSGNRAPASGGTTTISALLDKSTEYIFDSNATYVYNQADGVTTSSFAFSVEDAEAASWITLENNNTVKAPNRWKDNGFRRQGDITATFNDGTTTVSGAATLYQEANRRYAVGFVLTGYSILLAYSPSGAGYQSITVPKEGGDIYIKGTATYLTEYAWPSGAPHDTESESRAEYPDTISVSPDAGVVVDTGNSSVSLPANVSTSGKDYTIEAACFYNGVWKTSEAHTATVEGFSYTYDDPVITEFYYPSAGSGYQIPASGGTAYPVVKFTQNWYIDGQRQDNPITGSLSGGATRGTASDGSTFYVSYAGSNVASDGGVYGAPKGTTPSAATTITNNAKVTVGCNDRSRQSSSAAVVQQLNQVERSEYIITNASISNVAALWSGQSANVAPSRGGTGSFSFSATKSYETYDVYTSGSPKRTGSGSGPASFANGDIEIASKPSWISGVGDNWIEASKNGSTSNRTDTLTLRIPYDGGAATASLSLTQLKLVITHSLECVQGSVSLPASGQTVNLTFLGITNYDNGDASDSTPLNANQVSFVSGNNIAGRISHTDSNTYHRVKGENLHTTPYDETSTTYTYRWTSYSSATCEVPVEQEWNINDGGVPGPWIQGTKVYGTSYTDIDPDSYWASVSLSPDYSELSPAPKTGATVTVSASAGHQQRTAKPWTRTDTRTVTYTWTSEETSTGSESSTVGGTDYGSYSQVPDTATITLSPASMLSRSGSIITVTPNSGDARIGLVYVTNGSYASDLARIYQRAGNISLSVDNDDLTFPNTGGTQRIVVTAVSTGWTLTKEATTDLSPFTGGTVTPSSGSAGTKTVTITIARHASAQYGDSPRRGLITITADEDETVQAVVRVFQEPAIDNGS